MTASRRELLRSGARYLALGTLAIGAGWLLDNWLGTIPLFMIVFTVLAAVGLFTKSKYRYEEKMERLDAERRGGRNQDESKVA